MRRAQAALEYLFTYGWAFLAILITVGSLAYFGVFNINNFRGDSCDFPPGIDCQDYTLTDDLGSGPELRVNLRNLYGADLNLTAVDARSDITGPITNCGLADGSTISSSAGEPWDFETVINISCPIDSADYFSNQGYDFTVQLEFVQRDHSYVHESTGILQLRSQ